MNDSLPAQAPPLSSTSDFLVVGIGASAGGISALQSLFERLPANAGVVYVVVLHLSPEHESHIAEILQRVTAMPVEPVVRTVTIAPDRVYVISPRSQLNMYDGKLEPSAAAARHGQHPMAIDLFFDALAQTHGHRAAGIVLSGSGSDGALGIRAIKAHGGVTFAQEPGEAEYDSMPRNAIATGGVDFVLPVAQIASRLVATWQNARAISLSAPLEPRTEDDKSADTDQSLHDIIATLRARTRHDFSAYKRATVMRRVERRMQVTQLRDLRSYGQYLGESSAECNALLDDLLINVTSFFRDRAVFDHIEATILPALFADRGASASIRVWVPCCATGEEAYSLAMLLAEFAERLPSPPSISIFATDISAEALAIAREGVYPESVAEQISPERVRRWMVHEEGCLRVNTQLREMMLFASHNVLQDPPFSHLDLVSCRNFLIYLTRPAQVRVLDLLHFALRPEGTLVLGLSESIDEVHEGFATLDRTLRIYSQRPRPRAALSFTPVAQSEPVGIASDGTTVSRMLSSADLHQRLLEHYAPPSVVVDERYDIVHVSETAGRFLRFGAGEPSLNLLKSLSESVRYEIKGALDEAIRSMRPAERPGVAMQQGPELVRVDITVHPVRDRDSMRTFALVLFDRGLADTRIDSNRSQAHLAETAALERRARDMQNQLHAATEQFELQHEELTTSNEELQATNEELRATTEELETGKEELQSMNEELRTVNQELKHKIDESTRVGDDLQNFILATGVAALFVDREMRLMRYTPFAREIFNVIPADIGRPLLDITHRLQGVDLQKSIADLLDTLRVSEYEVRTGDDRWFVMRLLPYRTVDEHIGGAVLTFLDITQRKVVESTNLRSEAWARVVVESVREYAIMTLDSQGIVQTWNLGAQQIFGYEPSEIVGQSFTRLFTSDDRAAGTPEAELRTASEVGRASDERWQLRKDGTQFFASGICAPLVEPQTFGFVKILRDLTQHQLAEQHREELLKMERLQRTAAEEANKVKDEFLATLSHEMRNPLALIQMQAELLLRSPETRRAPRLQSAAQIIFQTIKAQAQFVEDMLDVSRLRTGKLAIDRQLLPLPLVIADSIGGLRDEADEADITLNVEIESEPMIVEADVVRVKQIAWNLVSNALKFTPRGGQVTVRLRREGDQARLDVEDNGQGIAPEVLPHIFDWFRQAESGSTRRKGGMGIGLALVKQLVELHGGRVTGRSSGLGKGACFSVWLPLQNAESRGIAQNAPPLGNIPAAAARLAGRKLLIIDDMADNASAMGELLQFEGADVALEVTAHDAIKRAANERFDLIISDLAMPEMDGYTMLAQLRRSPLNATTPAIAYSGYGGADEVGRSKEAGFALHLTKPVDVEHLLDAIESILRTSASSEGTREGDPPG